MAAVSSFENGLADHGVIILPGAPLSHDRPPSSLALDPLSASITLSGYAGIPSKFLYDAYKPRYILCALGRND